MLKRKYNKLNKIKNLLSLNSLQYIFYFIFLIKSIKSQCNKDTPILFNDTCQLKNCSKTQFDNNECIISNKIIKTQWLTNIIQIGKLNYRYINFASFSNGDMIVETSACPNEGARMFYGIKSDGSPLFKNENDNSQTYCYYIEVEGQTDTQGKRYESENSIIIINSGDDKGKEYLVSFGKTDQFAELYLFDERKINQRKVADILNNNKIENSRFASFNYINNNNYYIFLGYKSSSGLFFTRLCFNSNSFNNNPQIYQTSRTDNIGGSLSCFMTSSSNSVICAYISNILNINNFCRLAVDENFNQKVLQCYPNNISSDSNVFVKAIHLKDESGVFTYFNIYNNHYYPILLFQTLKQISTIYYPYYTYIFADSITSYSYFGLNTIANNKNIFFNTYCLKNDLIKIKEDKICYITSSNTNETLYIIMINVFESSLSARY